MIRKKEEEEEGNASFSQCKIERTFYTAVNRMKQFVFLELLKLILLSFISCEHDLSDDGAHGVRISGNEQFTVFARNSEKYYSMTYGTYKNCEITYLDSSYYVYSLAVVKPSGSINQDSTFKFIQISERMTADFEVILSVYATRYFPLCHIDDWIEISIRKGIHQIYMNIKITPNNRYAYVFADSFVLSFDIETNQIIELINSTDIFLSSFFPRAFDLTDDWAVVTGIEFFGTYYGYRSLIIRLKPMSGISDIDATDATIYNNAKAQVYDRINDMSVSINPQNHLILVSYPIQQRIFIAELNTTKYMGLLYSVSIKHEIHWSTANMGFGRSVAWIDDKTFAITMFTTANRPWSRSEVWIFAINSSFSKPLFVFPNNQQTIVFNQLPLFLHMISWSAHLFILTDQSKALLIRSRPAGFLSIWSDTHRSTIVYKSSACIGGTYKNQSSPGPCFICPSQTKNPSHNENQSCTECISCAADKFCPLGSIDEISLENFQSYIQTYAYPETSDINSYDDILMRTIYELLVYPECYLRSPTFWTIIVLIFCFLLWLFVYSIKSSEINVIIRLRLYFKRLSMKTDGIIDRRKWISFLRYSVIIVFLAFVYWFAADHLNAYPIEKVESQQTTCSQIRQNSDFESALQLPLPSIQQNNGEILNLFSKQRLAMTIDFLNTQVPCENIIVQQNMPRTDPIKLNIHQCLLDSSTNATRSIEFYLPSHPVNIEIIIYGPYFIGGVRFCLRGPRIQNDDENILQSLDVCQFYSTVNQTIGRFLTLSIVLVKTINQTDPLNTGKQTLYHGRWIPTWNDVIGLSDEFVCLQYGEHIRYASDRSTILISLSEHPFFLYNKQKPIIRRPELILHTMLFTSLIIEIFAIGYFILRIIIVSILRAKLNYFNRTSNLKHQKNPSIAEEPSTDARNSVCSITEQQTKPDESATIIALP